MSKTPKKPVKYRWGASKDNVAKAKPKAKSKFEPKQEGSTSQYQRRKQVLKGYEQWVWERFNSGYDIYLFSFMFNEMPGNERAKIEGMNDEIKRLYSKLTTRIARKPRTHSGHRLLPLMILYPDKAVYKSFKRKLSLKEAKTNDGLHFHGICAADRRGRLKNFLDEYFETFQSDFTTQKLRSIHVQRVHSMPRYVTDYALKSFKRPWFKDDDIIVLPRTLDEVADQKRRRTE